VVEELRNFIGGQWTDTAFDKRAELINPSTGEAFATSPVSGEAEVDAAFSSAAEAFDGWRDATPGERSLALLRIADAIEARADEFVAAESRNTGKPIALTTSEEIPPMVDQIRFFAGAARMLEGRSAGEYMSGFTSFIRREPVGVCAQVTPCARARLRGGVDQHAHPFASEMPHGGFKNSGYGKDLSSYGLDD
jgi:betaine-aldehyde dehydrogenase